MNRPDRGGCEFAVTYHILMRVHEDVELVGLGDAEHLHGEVNPFIIIDTRTFMFNRLPGEQISDGIVAPFPQTGEVGVGVVKGEGSTDEGDVIGIEESVGDVGGGIRIPRILAFTSYIDPTKRHLSILRVSKGLAIHPDAK